MKTVLALLIILNFLVLPGCGKNGAVETGPERIDKSKAIPPVPGACDEYGAPQIVGNLQSDLLPEVSGLVASRKNPGVFWVHNDSGDGPFVYAINESGMYLGRFELEGAIAKDWEDISTGPCETTGQCLYIGEIGDNKKRRPSYGVYRVKEPDVDATTPFGDLLISDWELFEFKYKDKSHNCEAMVVDHLGRIFLFEKRMPFYTNVFMIADPDPDKMVTAEKIGKLETGLCPKYYVTAADLHPSGRALLLRTYNYAFEWRIPEGAPFEAFLDVDSEPVPVAEEPQGEAVAYNPASGGYYLISEGTGSPIYKIGCEK